MSGYRNVDLASDEVDDGAQGLERLEAVRPFHRCFYLAVQALYDSRRDPAVDELKNALPVTLDSSLPLRSPIPAGCASPRRTISSAPFPPRSDSFGSTAVEVSACPGTPCSSSNPSEPSNPGRIY